MAINLRSALTLFRPLANLVGPPLRRLYASEVRFVVAVLLVTLAVKIPLVSLVGGGERLSMWGQQHGDVYRYLDQTATALAGDLDLTVNGRPARHGPVYPAIIAFVFGLFGHNQYDAVRFLQLGLIMVVSAILYYMSRVSWGRGVANWALAISCVWFSGFYWSAELLTEVCAVFLLSCTLLFLFEARLRLLFIVPAGLTLGLGSQTRITLLLFLPGFCLWVALVGYRKGLRPCVLAVGLFLGSFALVYMPLKAAYGEDRGNDKYVRAEVLGQAYFGLTLKVPPTVDADMSRLEREWFYAGHIFREARASDLWHRLIFTKVLGFWYPLYNANNGAYYLFDYTLFFITPFFLIGLLTAPRNMTYWLLVGTFCTVYVTILLFLYGYPRHRFPADLALIPIGAYGLKHFTDGYVSSRASRLFLAVYVALSLALVAGADLMFAALRSLYYGSR